MDSSGGSAKVAGDDLPVPPAAMAAGDPAFVIPTQACRSLLSVMPTFLLLSVVAFFFSPVLVLGTYVPFPLASPFC